MTTNFDLDYDDLIDIVMSAPTGALADVWMHPGYLNEGEHHAPFALFVKGTDGEWTSVWAVEEDLVGVSTHEDIQNMLAGGDLIPVLRDEIAEDPDNMAGRVSADGQEIAPPCPFVSSGEFGEDTWCSAHNRDASVCEDV